MRGQRTPFTLGQRDGEVADPAGGVGLELLHLCVGPAIGEGGIADLLPGVEQRLLGEGTCELESHRLYPSCGSASRTAPNP